MPSLDPRINRIGLSDVAAPFTYASTEGSPYDMFWISKPTKPYEHVGIVHAFNPELALLYAKEQYSRRGGQCYGLLAIASDAIWATSVENDGTCIFDEQPILPANHFLNQPYHVFGLKRRGKHHILLGQIEGTSPQEFENNLMALRQTPCVNLWLAPVAMSATLESGPEGLWQTLHEKQYREATAYKSAEKIKAFLALK